MHLGFSIRIYPLNFNCRSTLHTDKLISCAFVGQNNKKKNKGMFLGNLYGICVAVTVRFSWPSVAMHSAPTCCPTACCVPQEAAESVRVVLAGAEKPRLRSDSVPQAGCWSESRTVPTTWLWKTFPTIKPLETRSAKETLALSGEKISALSARRGILIDGRKTGEMPASWVRFNVQYEAYKVILKRTNKYTFILWLSYYYVTYIN